MKPAGRTADPHQHWPYADGKKNGRFLKEEDIYFGHSFNRILASRLARSRFLAARAASATSCRAPDVDLNPYLNHINTTAGSPQRTHKKAERESTGDAAGAKDANNSNLA